MLYNELDWAILKLENLDKYITDEKAEKKYYEIIDLLYEHERKIKRGDKFEQNSKSS